MDTPDTRDNVITGILDRGEPAQTVNPAPLLEPNSREYLAYPRIDRRKAHRRLDLIDKNRHGCKLLYGSIDEIIHDVYSKGAGELETIVLYTPRRMVTLTGQHLRELCELLDDDLVRLLQEFNPLFHDEPAPDAPIISKMIFEDRKADTADT